MISNDPLVGRQWHLENLGQMSGTADVDLDIQQAWSQTKGQNVTIGFVADGLQHDHPDLVARFLPALSYNFATNSSNVKKLDRHDTSVAGIAIASGDNGIGVSGIAPQAKFAILGIDTRQWRDAAIARALSHQRDAISIYNNSWGPPDNGGGLDAPGALITQALEDGVQKGRNGLGNIFVWAGGNGKQFKDNVNYDGYANSRYTLAVSAVDFNGRQPDYSEPGAAIFVAAFSSGGGGAGLLTTTLFEGDGASLDGYDPFGRTSASASVVSGVVALMLSRNPNLGWRDVQHILANTSVKTDPTDSDWKTNGAGFNINHKYGFGAVNAGAAVTLAGQWQNVGAEVAVTSGDVNINRAIPDNNSSGLVSTVNITQNIQVESAEVVFDATHSYRGNLAVTLVSPDGTESVLTEVHNDSGDNYSRWSLTSVRHWGESAQGNWTLRVTDGAAGNTGTWNNWRLNLYGSNGNGVSSGPPEDLFDVPTGAILGTAAGEYLEGTASNDYVVGGGGSDYIWAGAGTDIINATTTTLKGKNEWDQLLGAGGADVFILGDAAGVYYAAQGNGDLAFLPDFEAGVDKVVLHGTASDYVLSPNAPGEMWLSLTNGETIARFVTNSALNLGNLDQFWYVAGGDVPVNNIVGTAAGEYLEGGNGSDNIIGGGGSDYIWAGLGADIINATNAELRGNNEWDQLLGAGGADTFVLGDAAGAYYTAQGNGDVAFMPDFEAGVDKVVLHGSASDYTLAPNGQGEVWLSLTNGELVGRFVTSSSLSLSQFQYVS